MSKKNSNDTSMDLTRDLPACSAVPQPAVPPRAPCSVKVTNELMEQFIFQNTTPWLVRGVYCKCVSNRHVVEFLKRKSNICA
jgi:hypothetical protein